MKDFIHTKTIKIPIYKSYLVIMVSNSLSLVNKELPGFGSETLYAHALLCNWKKRERNIMVLNPCSATKLDYGVIAHEAVHLAGFIGSELGFVADFSNDEPIAYLVEWITNETHKFLKEKKIKV